MENLKLIITNLFFLIDQLIHSLQFQKFAPTYTVERDKNSGSELQQNFVAYGVRKFLKAIILKTQN